MKGGKIRLRQQSCPHQWGVILVLGLFLFVGCGQKGKNVAVRLQQKESLDRIREIRRIDAAGDESAMPLLVQRLDDEDSAVRFAAIMTLERMTGDRFGYQYGASAMDRSDAVGRWRAFVEERAGGN